MKAEVKTAALVGMLVDDGRPHAVLPVATSGPPLDPSGHSHHLGDEVERSGQVVAVGLQVILT